jgi:hypothetical protein
VVYTIPEIRILLYSEQAHAQRWKTTSQMGRLSREKGTKSSTKKSNEMANRLRDNQRI